MFGGDLMKLHSFNHISFLRLKSKTALKRRVLLLDFWKRDALTMAVIVVIDFSDDVVCILTHILIT